MDGTNWTKVWKRKQQDRERRQRSISIKKAAFVPLKTNVLCPDGTVGRVVKHEHGLNIVINGQGHVIGSFATADLKLWKPEKS